MNLVTALVAIAGLLTATMAVGGYLRWRQGRPQRHIPHEVVENRLREKYLK